MSANLRWMTRDTCGGLFAALVGLAGLSCQRNDVCETSDNPPSGIYRVVDSRFRPELVGATVEVMGASVVVTYTLEDGSRWRVTYRVGGAVPY